MDNFNLKKYLIENKLKEASPIDYPEDIKAMEQEIYTVSLTLRKKKQS